MRVGVGGADRDRTDDLKLAKLPLSQLSYGPTEGASSEQLVANRMHYPLLAKPYSLENWWARVDSNYRPYAYQAYALTT